MSLDLGSSPLFLLGAGASVDAGVPATVEMTEKLVSEIADQGRFTKSAEALNFVCGALMAYDSASGKSPYAGLDVERVFAAVELLAERNDLEVTPFVAAWHPAVDAWDRKRAPGFFDQNLAKTLLEGRGEPAHRLIGDLVSSMTGPGTGEIYQQLAGEMVDRLRKVVAPPYGSLSYLVQLVGGIRSAHRLTIATLNYDLTVEMACKEAGIAVDTGIEHWIEDRQWKWAENGSRLLKLHGSIDWLWEWRDASDGDMSVPTVAHTSEPESDRRKPALVFGSRNKLRPDGPFLSLLNEFEDKLSEADQLIVVGYSFRDEHINEIVRRWTRDDKARTLVLIDPDPQEVPNGRGFREELIRRLNPYTYRSDEQLPRRIEIREETAAEAFAQVTLDCDAR